MRRVALVTGGGTGIGRGIAIALARRGVDIAVVGRRAEPLAEVVGEVMAIGVRAVALPADLTSAQARAELPARLHATLGPVDILVNNAGVLAGGEVAGLHPAAVEQAIALNLLTPLALVQLLLPDLISQRGAVVFVASALGLVPLPGGAVYAATKAGMTAFAQALHYEMDPRGVQVLVAYPPGTRTAMIIGMASAAHLPAYPLADPEAVGERIVRALTARQREVRWGTGERMLTLLHHWTPALAHKLIRWQRQRLITMLSSPHE